LLWCVEIGASSAGIAVELGSWAGGCAFAGATAKIGVDRKLEAGCDGQTEAERGDLDEDVYGRGGVVAGGEEVEHKRECRGSRLHPDEDG
jgi:hypothetical protein